MAFLDRKLWTLEGVVLSSWAIQPSPRPSSTQRRIFDACGFNATLLFPTSSCSFDACCFLVHMYHFLFLDARCITRGLGRRQEGRRHEQHEEAARGPADGAHPVREDEEAVGGGDETPPENGVLRRLEKGGGEPHDCQEHQPEQGQEEGYALRRPDHQRDGGSGL